MARNKQALRASLAAVASLGLITACAPQSGPSSSGAGDTGASKVPDSITVGATLPLTGAESKAGGFYKEGYELAFDLINKDGGVDVGGKKVKMNLNLLDDTTDQSKAVNLAQRLINQDKVPLFLGTYSTPLVQAQSTVAEQAKIPYVNGGGAATDIYSRGYKYVFGTLAPVTNLASAEMDWLTSEQNAGHIAKPAKVAVLYENTSHGKDFEKGIKDWAASGKGQFQVVMDESFALDGQDYSALLNKVKAANADLMMVDAHTPDFITMQRQYASSNMCHQVLTYGARGTEAEARKALGPDNVKYVVSAVWWNAQLGDAGLNKTFVDAFKAKYNRAPEWYQAVGYTAAQALFEAVHNAKSLDPDKVRQALVDLNSDSILPGGKLKFGSNGQASYPFVVQQNMADGTSPIIWPKEDAKAPGVAPNPACKR